VATLSQVFTPVSIPLHSFTPLSSVNNEESASVNQVHGCEHASQEQVFFALCPVAKGPQTPCVLCTPCNHLLCAYSWGSCRCDGCTVQQLSDPILATPCLGIRGRHFANRGFSGCSFVVKNARGHVCEPVVVGKPGWVTPGRPCLLQTFVQKTATQYFFFSVDVDVTGSV